MKRLFLLLFLAAPLYLYSQVDYSTTGDPYVLPTPASPSVSELMKYIDYPATLNNGLVNIEIPLHELNVGELTIPISISYHGAGIKVAEANGRLGVGWSLNAELSVSRSGNGIPDEKAHGYLHCTLPSNGSDEFVRNIISNRWGEEEPDLFYYRLLSKSGKFFYRRDPYVQHSVPEVVTVPFEPIKISNDANNKLIFFEITDDDGTSYRFGKPGYSDEGLSMTNNTRSQWKVSEIITPVRRDTVYYSYGTVKSWTSLEEVDFILVEDVPISGQEADNPLSIEYPQTPGNPCIFKVQWPYLIKGRAYSTSYDFKLLRKESVPDAGSKLVEKDGMPYGLGTYFSMPSGTSVIMENCVSVIETPNIKVLFEDNSMHELTSIKIAEKSSGAIIRTIRFMQSEYQNKNNTMQKKKLDKVEVLDRNNKIVETYTFDYKNPGGVAFYGNKSEDHWGYNTSGGGSRTAVPSTTVSVYYNMDYKLEGPYEISIGESSKSAATDDYLTAGILKSITYPTGRKSVFTFESNTYSDGTAIKRGGGLRIARIEEYESGKSTPSLVKSYKYGRTEKGEGYIKKIPSPDEYMYEQTTHIIVPTERNASGDQAAYYNGSARSRIYTSTSLCGAAYDNGSHVFYDYVTEYKLDHSGNPTSGKTVYEYSQPDTRGFYYVPGTYLSFGGTGEWHGSKLICKTDYKYVGPELFEPHVKNVYSYNTFKTGDYVFNKYYVNKHFVGPWEYRDFQKQQLLAYGGFSEHQTFFVLGCERLVSEATYEYTYGSSPREMITTRQYGHDNDKHMYITQTTRTDSEGRNIVSRIRYPQDVSYMVTSEENGRQELVNGNRLNIPLEQETIRDGITQTGKTKYHVVDGRALPVTILTNTGQNGMDEERAKILQYDSFGNPVRINKDGVETIFLWGYNGRFAIAQIDGVEFSQLPSSLGISRINEISARDFPSSADWSLIDGLRTNSSLPYARITTYTYDKIRGMTSSTNPQGIKTGYGYDAFDRLNEVYVMEGTSKRILETYEYYYETE